MVLAPQYGSSGGGGSMTGPEIITAIGNDGVGNAQIASVANTVKGDIGAGLADLTAAQARLDFLAMFDDFNSSFIFDTGVCNATGMSETAINGGTVGTLIDQKWGNAHNFLTNAAATANSGRIMVFGQFIGVSLGVGREFFGVFHTAADLTDVVWRIGASSTNFSGTGTGGNSVFFHLTGSTFSMVCEAATVLTTHATTLAATADTEYWWRIRRSSATEFTFTLYSTAGAVLLTGTVAGAPPTTNNSRYGYQAYNVGAVSAKNIGRYFRLGTRYRA